MKLIKTALLATLIAWVNADGKTGCECLTDYPDYSVKNGTSGIILNFEGETFEWQGNGDYGLNECRAWDSGLGDWLAENRIKSKGDISIFTNDEWCYVSKDCSNAVSFESKWNSRNWNRDLYYSYSTCGNIDRYYNYVQKTYLKDRPLKAGIISDINYDAVKWNDTLNYVEGAQWNMVSMTADDLGHSKDLIVVPPNQISLDKGFGSPWNAVPRETAMDVVDIAYGSIFTFPIKLKKGRFSPTFHFSDLSFVTKTNRETDSLSFIQSFNTSTWIFLLCILLCQATFLSYFEYRTTHGWQWYPQHTKLQHCWTQFCYTVASVFDFGMGVPMSTAGKIGNCFFALLMWFVICNFTANMTYLRFEVNRSVQYKNIDDLVAAGGTACILFDFKEELKRSTPLTDDNIYTVMFEFSQSAQLDWYRSGKCDVILTQKEIMEQMHAEGRNCDLEVEGDPVIRIPLSFAVSDKVFSSVSYAMVHAWEQDYIFQSIPEYQPLNKCEWANKNFDKVGFEDVSMVVYIWIFVVVATLTNKGYWWYQNEMELEADWIPGFDDSYITQTLTSYVEQALKSISPTNDDLEPENNAPQN